MHPFSIQQARFQSQASPQPAKALFVMAGYPTQFNTAASFATEGEVAHG